MRFVRWEGAIPSARANALLGHSPPDKYAVLVAKHADGFTLWPSKSYEPLGINYTIADSPYALHSH